MLDDFDQVLARARAGSGDAFALLYEDLARPVAAYLRAKGVADVEDVTSEVFLAVFTGLGRFVGDQAQLRSWVFTIAHRRVVDGWRCGGRTPDLVAYEPAARPARGSRHGGPRRVPGRPCCARAAGREADVCGAVDGIGGRLTGPRRLRCVPPARPVPAGTSRAMAVMDAAIGPRPIGRRREP